LTRLIEQSLAWFHNAASHAVVDPERTFFDPGEFAWTAEIEASWPVMRTELCRLLETKSDLPTFHDVSPRQARISNDDWKTFFFRVYGNDIPEAKALCPFTSQIVRRIPGMFTAFFSILGKGQVIPPHRGPHKGVLRYHLGLVVPVTDERCAIRVGCDVQSWQEGRSMIFDDTHEHEVWNRTEFDRAVLFVDFARPIPGMLNLANKAILLAAKYTHPDVKQARLNAKRFAGRLNAAVPVASAG